jgi:hypothetical protein
MALVSADIDRRVKVIDGEGKGDRSIERVSDLRAMPFVVLLSEPGIGKSTVLAREAANEGASVIFRTRIDDGHKGAAGRYIISRCARRVSHRRRGRRQSSHARQRNSRVWSTTMAHDLSL